MTRTNPPGRRQTIPLVLLACFFATCSAVSSQEVRRLVITQPAHHGVVLWKQGNANAASLRVEGTFVSESWAEEDQILVDASRLDRPGTTSWPAQVTLGEDGLGRWVVNELQVKPGVLVALQARMPGALDRKLVIVIPPNFAPGSQKISLHWRPATEALLHHIAASTLNPQPNLHSLFAKRVQERVQELLEERFQDFAFELVPQGDPEAYQLTFHELANDYFGYTEAEHIDCWNQTTHGESTIHVGTLAERLARDFALPGGPRRWRPMNLSDSPAQRQEDVAQALAATAAHELLHGAGLVQCSWLFGAAGHNNPEPRYNLLPEAQFFGSGDYLMDHGATVPPYRRISESSSSRRGAERRLRTLNPFNTTYLSLAHPKP